MSAERRVLHVLEALEGGTARHVIDVVRWVEGWEHHVAVPTRRRGAPTDARAAGRLRAAGAHVHVVEMARMPPHPRNAIALVRLRLLIRRLRPAVVHGHSSIGGALARTATIGSGLPVVYTPNALARGRAALAVERVLGRRTARLVAVSPSEAEEVLAARLVPPARLVVIPNGVDLDAPGDGPAPDLRALAGVPAGAPLVGSVARLTSQKAPEVFVAAAARVLAARPDAHALLVGDGTEAGRAVLAGALAEARAGGPDLEDRFHHLAEVDGVGRALDQLDVFLLTSRFEGAPYTVLEAMRAGAAMVLTDAVGNRDAVVDGESGRLVRVDDPAAAADAVLALLGDAGARAALGAAAAARVAERFGNPGMGRRLADLYGEITARKSFTPRS